MEQKLKDIQHELEQKTRSLETIKEEKETVEQEKG